MCVGGTLARRQAEHHCQADHEDGALAWGQAEQPCLKGAQGGRHVQVVQVQSFGTYFDSWCTQSNCRYHQVLVPTTSDDTQMRD